VSEHVLNAERRRRGRPRVKGRITVVHQIARRLIQWERFTELLGRPRGGGMIGIVTATWTIRRRSCARITRTNNKRHVAVGTTKKSAAAIGEGDS
jgi:hypothetical protein